MSKRVVYLAGTLPPSLSPITPSGQVVYSIIKHITDPHDRTKEYVEEITPDGEDAIKVLKFLDEQNGIGWTLELKRIEKELRTALIDLVATNNQSQDEPLKSAQSDPKRKANT